MHYFGLAKKFVQVFHNTWKHWNELFTQLSVLKFFSFSLILKEIKIFLWTFILTVYLEILLNSFILVAFSGFL